MKYKIIEVPYGIKENDKKYIVEVMIAGGILFLDSNFKLSYETAAFSSIEAAKQALAKFIHENPIHSNGKRIVEEGEI